MTVAGFHFYRQIASSRCLVSTRPDHAGLARAHPTQPNTWLKPLYLKSSWTTQTQQSSSAMCRLSAGTQPVTYAWSSVTTHFLPLSHRACPGTCIWDTTWICWIFVTLSSTAAAQISPWPHNWSGCSHWIHSLSAGEQLLNATRDVHNPAPEFVQQSPLGPGVPCCHVTAHLPARELLCFPRKWRGKNEGKFT